MGGTAASRTCRARIVGIDVDRRQDSAPSRDSERRDERALVRLPGRGATTPRSVAAIRNGTPPPSRVVYTAWSSTSRVCRGPGVGVDRPRYTPLEYVSTSHRRDRAAHRGHDLRVLRQPDRAVPAQDADGVESANVNLATELATIRYLPAVAGRAELVAAVEAAGYDVRPGPGAATEAALADATLAAADADATPSAARVARLLVEAVASIAVARRDHGRDVRARRRASRWRPSTGSRSSPRRSSRSGPAGASTAPRGAPPATATTQHGHAGRHRHERRLGATASS